MRACNGMQVQVYGTTCIYSSNDAARTVAVSVASPESPETPSCDDAPAPPAAIAARALRARAHRHSGGLVEHLVDAAIVFRTALCITGKTGCEHDRHRRTGRLGTQAHRDTATLVRGVRRSGPPRTVPYASRSGLTGPASPGLLEGHT